MINILLIIAGAMIIALAAVALYLHWRLYQLRKEQAAAEVQAAEKREEQRRRINSSIQIIAQALGSDQVGATEASIRISVLLDALEVHETVKGEFAAFYKLAQEAAHIPILDAWKALPKQKRRAFEIELITLEEKYQDFVVDAAERIRGREF